MNSNLALGLKRRCASLLLLDREPFENNLQRTESGQKNVYSSASSLGCWDSGGCNFSAARRRARTRPGARVQVGCFERRLVRSRANENQLRDVQVRFSIRPCLPELELGVPSFMSRPSFVPVEYPGWSARYTRSGYPIATTTRHILTLQSRIPAGFLPQIAAADQGQGRGSCELDVPLGALVPALAVRATC